MLVAGIAKYSNPSRADFFITYSGGLVLRKGDASKLYDLNEQRRVQERLFKRRGWLFDPYPPFHALLFAPLTWLGYRDAYLAWGAFNVLLWLFFFYILQHQTMTFREPFRDLVLCSLYYPLWIALMQGQLSLVLLVSFTLTYVYLKRHQDYTSGLCLGLGLIKFQAVLFFSIVHLLSRRWKFILGFASAGCFLVLLSFMAVGPAGVLSYVNLILDILRHPNNPAYANVRPWNMITIGGFLSEALGQSVGKYWIKALAMTFSSVLILLTAWRWRVETRLGNRAAFEPLFASTLAVSLVASPYLLLHDLTPLILAVVLIVNSPQWACRSRARTILKIAIGLLYAIPFGFPLVHHPFVFVLAPVLVLFAVSALALASNDSTHHIPVLSAGLRDAAELGGRPTT